MRPDPFLHLETDPGLGDPAVGEPPVDESGEGEGEWAGPSQEEWEQTQQALQYFAQLEQQRQAEANGGQQQGIPDPYAEPDEFQRWLDSRVDERVQPFQQITEQMRMNEDVERQFDVLADNESREGEFLIREATEECPVTSSEMAIAVHYAFLDEALQRYGNTPRAQEAALQQAYKTIRGWEEAVSRAALERRDNQLSTLSGARREPAAGGAEGTSVVPVGGPRDVLSRHFPVHP